MDGSLNVIAERGALDRDEDGRDRASDLPVPPTSATKELVTGTTIPGLAGEEPVCVFCSRAATTRGESMDNLPGARRMARSLVPSTQMFGVFCSDAVARRDRGTDESVRTRAACEFRGRSVTTSLDDRAAGLSVTSDEDAGFAGTGDVRRRLLP